MHSLQPRRLQPRVTKRHRRSKAATLPRSWRSKRPSRRASGFAHRAAIGYSRELVTTCWPSSSPVGQRRSAALPCWPASPIAARKASPRPRLAKVLDRTLKEAGRSRSRCFQTFVRVPGPPRGGRAPDPCIGRTPTRRPLQLVPARAAQAVTVPVVVSRSPTRPRYLANEGSWRCAWPDPMWRLENPVLHPGQVARARTGSRRRQAPSEGAVPP